MKQIKFYNFWKIEFGFGRVRHDLRIFRGGGGLRPGCNYVFKFIAGDALEAIKEATMENMSGDETDAVGGMMDAMMSPGAMAGFAIAGSLIVGAILSLIVAAIMKKENPNTI